MGGDIKKCMTVLNNAFLTRTFLVGERVTLADIAVCSNLVMLYQQVMEPSFRAPFGNVNRWFMTVINQPQCKKVLGEVKLCERMATFDSKKYFALHPKKDGKKKNNTRKTRNPSRRNPRKKNPRKKKNQNLKQPIHWLNYHQVHSTLMPGRRST